MCPLKITLSKVAIELDFLIIICVSAVFAAVFICIAEYRRRTRLKRKFGIVAKTTLYIEKKRQNYAFKFFVICIVAIGIIYVVKLIPSLMARNDETAQNDVSAPEIFFPPSIIPAPVSPIQLETENIPEKVEKVKIEANIISSKPSKPLEKKETKPKLPIQEKKPKPELPKKQNLDDIIHKFLADWQTAWQNTAGENGNIEAYMSLYSNNFKSSGFDKNKWKRDKTGKNANKKWIRIKLNNIKITKENGQLKVSFAQSYQSPNYSDTSNKTLVLSKEKTEWKIISEFT